MVVGFKLQPLSSLSCLVELRCLLARAPNEISLLTMTDEMAEGIAIFFSAMRLIWGAGAGLLIGVGLASGLLIGGRVAFAITGMGLAFGLGVVLGLGVVTALGLGVALGLLLAAPLVWIFCPTDNWEGLRRGLRLVSWETESPCLRAMA